MSRLRSDSGAVEKVRNGPLFRRGALLVLSFRIACVRFLACLFAAEIRFGNWLIAPDPQPASKHPADAPAPSPWATASFRLQDPSCPIIGMPGATRLMSRAKPLRIGISRCVLFPPCKFHRQQSRLSANFRSRRAN